MSRETGGYRQATWLLILAAACFGAVASAAPQNGVRQAAERILQKSGVRGGLVVHVGCGTGRMTGALHDGDAYLVHGLDADAEEVRKARAYLAEQDLYGDVTVETWDGEGLPYADGLVDLLVVEEGPGLSKKECMRVLSPGGVLCTRRGGEWVMQTKDWPQDIDEWSHFMHGPGNNPVAQDTRVGPLRRLRWKCGPLWSRSHEFTSSLAAMVSAGGRLFYVFDYGVTSRTGEEFSTRWTLVARDAFNGTLLWKRRLEKWDEGGWQSRALRAVPGAARRRLVGADGRVFISLGYHNASVSALDAATGKVERTYEQTRGCREIRVADGTLVSRVRTGKGKSRFVAVDIDSGKTQWKTDSRRVQRDQFAVHQGNVIFPAGGRKPALVCLSLSDGTKSWETSFSMRLQTLVAHGGRVVALGRGKVSTFSAENGEKLWSAKRGGGSAMLRRRDVFVARGRVWFGDKRHCMVGRDLANGEEKTRIRPNEILSLGHHPRCYRSKATTNYIMPPFRGVEFVSINGDRHAQSDWVRGACTYGVMPANGLVYAPQHPCLCYPGVKLKGLNALASAPNGVETEPDDATQLTKGPAYAGAEELASAGVTDDAWPMYRGNPARHAAASCTVPADAGPQWTADLRGELTPPVSAGGRVFVAAKDTCTVYALDAGDGDVLWRMRTGGRIDSPPTVRGKLVLFGSADGHVYCLRASDGELVWRFRAAPSERRIVVSDRLESAWPVHGSVLVKNGLAYCTAGRSTYLDGGIWVYALDVASGEVVHRKRLDTWTRTRPGADDTPYIPAHHMEGSLSQLLVSEGDYLYLGQYKLNLELEKQKVPYVKPGRVSPEGKPVKGKPYTCKNAGKKNYEKVQHDWLVRTWPELTEKYRERYGGWNLGRRRMGTHLVAPWGLLDDSWFNRTFWMYSDTWPGFYLTNRAAKAGQLVVVGARRTYSMNAYTSRNLQSPLPCPKGYLVLADSKKTKARLRPETQGTPKGYGFTRTREPLWFEWLPVRVRAMVLAGDRLFMAGPPGEPKVEDPVAAMRGKLGGVFAAVSAEDGTKLARSKLDAVPVFDGLIAADGRLFMSTLDGEVVCLGK